MESFKLWLEGNTDIQYLGSSKWAGDASVRFAIKGERYEYSVDPMFTETNPIRLRRGKELSPSEKFRFYVQEGWYGKAHNVAKKHGTLLSKPKLQPKPLLSPIPRTDWQASPEIPKQQTRFDF